MLHTPNRKVLIMPGVYVFGFLCDSFLIFFGSSIGFQILGGALLVIHYIGLLDHIKNRKKI